MRHFPCMSMGLLAMMSMMGLDDCSVPEGRDAMKYRDVHFSPDDSVMISVNPFQCGSLESAHRAASGPIRPDNIGLFGPLPPGAVLAFTQCFGHEDFILRKSL
jgi:hypothetical protein